MNYEILKSLKKSLKDYDREECVACAKKALEVGIDPLKAIDALMEVMQEIGNAYIRGDIFLPELVGAGSAMEAAMVPLNDEIAKRGIQKKTFGTVVIATVYGDIHSIGKAMVSTFLTAGGFTVQDLGINVKATEFVAAVRQYRPDILAMSALLTTTAREQKVVIDSLKVEGLRDQVKVMVGGGAITEEFANSIGADGYAPTAPLAWDLARRLMQDKRR